MGMAFPTEIGGISGGNASLGKTSMQSCWYLPKELTGLVVLL